MQIARGHPLWRPGMPPDLADYYAAFAPWPDTLAAALLEGTGRAANPRRLADLAAAALADPDGWAAAWVRTVARAPADATAEARAYYRLEDGALACGIAGCQLLPTHQLQPLVIALRGRCMPGARRLPRAVTDAMARRLADPADPGAWRAFADAALPS